MNADWRPNGRDLEYISLESEDIQGPRIRGVDGKHDTKRACSGNGMAVQSRKRHNGGAVAVVAEPPSANRLGLRQHLPNLKPEKPTASTLCLGTATTRMCVKVQARAVSCTACCVSDSAL